MPAVPRHRQPIINAAVALFRRQGFARTGLNEIEDISGAPKGSLYHYFPLGKSSIAVAAVEERAGGWLRLSKTWQRNAVQPANCCAHMQVCSRAGCRNQDFAMAARS